jgi:hypothetical protein
MSRLLPTKARLRGEREREKGSGFAHWRCNNNQQQQPVFFSLGTQPFSSSRIPMKTVVDKQNKTVLQDFFVFLFSQACSASLDLDLDSPSTKTTPIIRRDKDRAGRTTCAADN